MKRIKKNNGVKIRGKLLASVSAIFFGATVHPVQADPTKNYYSGTVHGGIGLLETRTARFAPDGSFEVGASFVNPYRRYFMNWQIFPWMEATFRYVDPTNSPHGLIGYDQSQGKFYNDLLRFTSGGTNLDRGFDVKFKLFSEGQVRPSIAIGLQDFIGTGLFSGEYIVASKKIGDFDFSLGMGWGRIGSKSSLPNPMKIFGSRFNSRSASGGLGGGLNPGEYFSGNKVGLFGGVEYLTPYKGLTLKLEYNGAKLSADRDVTEGFKYLKETLPINVGLNYRVAKWLDASIAWERGNSLMIRFALKADFTSSGIEKEINPQPKLTQRPKIKNYQTPDTKISNSISVTSDPIKRQAYFDLQNKYKSLSDNGYFVDFISIDGSKAKLTVNCVNCDIDNKENIDKELFFALFPERVEGVYLEVFEPGKEIRKYNLKKPKVIEASFNKLTKSDQLGSELLVKMDASNNSNVKLIASTDKSFNSFDFEDNSNETEAKENQSEAPPPSTYIAASIMRELSSNGFWGHSVHIGEKEATIFLSNWAFQNGARNVGWAAKLAASKLPEEIEVITISEVLGTIEKSRVSILRKDMENYDNGNGSHEETWVNAEIQAPKPVMDEIEKGFVNPLSYPSSSWWLTPELVQHIGNPTTGVLIADVNLDLGASFSPMPGLTFSGVGTRFIAGNLDKIQRKSDSVVHHVRSDIVEYLQQGRTGIKNLQVDYFNSLGSGWYGRIAAGLFEQMYGGVGVEVLHRPFEKKWALGLDVNWVKQRDFNQLFRFRKYNIVTGHLTFNYDLPFYGMRATVSAGRYLAGDKGMTFEISRRFKSGIRMGAFATFTNLSAEEFGEGSFDKGFYISIPLELLLMSNSKQNQFFGFKPLTRDGGQKVIVGPSLYAITDNRSVFDFERDWKDFYK